MPILAAENVDRQIPVPQEIVHNVQGAFVLEVKGDSMIGEHIMPKDLVVIKPQETANNGDLVAVLIGDEATVKRIKFHSGKTKPEKRHSCSAIGNSRRYTAGKGRLIRTRPIS